MIPMTDVATVCRAVAADGAVLLKNKDGVLPLKPGTRVALFGRVQTDYYKSGTGSGGLVNVSHVPSILEALRDEPSLTVDETLAKVYADWIAEHPFDNGHGWGTEPWCQVEMPIDAETARAAAERNDVAVVLLGRTAGEDADNADVPGSYRLSETEEALVATVCSAFSHVIVLLNVGNMIDLGFVEAYGVSAVMYLWQGGMYGALSAADLLCGKATPAGKLPDTQLRTLDGHPALHDFGNRQTLIYSDDIYVGYRYFETFAPEKVLYPFGFGLSYTTFDVAYTAMQTDKHVTVSATVKNIGAYTGREVLQVYYGAPCGALGTPARQLVGFAKTRRLQPGESDTLTVTFPIAAMASYDDGGATGNRSCYVLEAGTYTVFAGTDVHSAAAVTTVTVDATTVVKRCEEALAPVQEFDRLCTEGADRHPTYRATPVRQTDLSARIQERLPEEIDFTGDVGIRLTDVAEGRHTLEKFVAQLTDTDLCALTCGEGPCSPKANPGAVGALGGLTRELQALGIPPLCVADGPSGVRMDDGSKATSFPSGTLVASTWDEQAAEELFAFAGEELKKYRVDSLLGPGLNLHRHPLNGRNFEYFSEDPFLTGKMAAAVTRGIARHGAGATIKHFCANNQELARNNVNVVVSERALRELYLRCFEIPVKEGGDRVSIMTSYNRVNGQYTASQYDLNTTILRGDWKYTGLVMTDWWAKSSDEGGEGSTENLRAMVRSQNDVFMVTADVLKHPHNLKQSLADGTLTRGELQRCAANLLRYMLGSQAMERVLRDGMPSFPDEDEMLVMVAQWEKPPIETELPVGFGHEKPCEMLMVYSCDAAALAQVPVRVYVDGADLFHATVSNTNGDIVSVKQRLSVPRGDHVLKIIADPSVRVTKLTIRQGR